MTRRSFVLRTRAEQVRWVSPAPALRRKELRQVSLRLLLSLDNLVKLFRKEHMTPSWRCRSPR